MFIPGKEYALCKWHVIKYGSILKFKQSIFFFGKKLRKLPYLIHNTRLKFYLLNIYRKTTKHKYILFVERRIQHTIHKLIIYWTHKSDLCAWHNSPLFHNFIFWYLAFIKRTIRFVCLKKQSAYKSLSKQQRTSPYTVYLFVCLFGHTNQICVLDIIACL